MNFSSLSANDKLAVYGSVAVIVGAAIGGAVTALGWIALLAAIAMLAIVFMPQLSPSTSLPGSKGSLMLVCGGLAAAIMILGLLTAIAWFGIYFGLFLVQALFFLVAVAGGLLMGYAGWMAFQAEGGKFEIGSRQPPSA